MILSPRRTVPCSDLRRELLPVLFLVRVGVAVISRNGHLHTRAHAPRPKDAITVLAHGQCHYFCVRGARGCVPLCREAKPDGWQRDYTIDARVSEDIVVYVRRTISRFDDDLFFGLNETRNTRRLFLQFNDMLMCFLCSISFKTASNLNALQDTVTLEIFQIWWILKLLQIWRILESFNDIRKSSKTW